MSAVECWCDYKSAWLALFSFRVNDVLYPQMVWTFKKSHLHQWAMLSCRHWGWFRIGLQYACYRYSDSLLLLYMGCTGITPWHLTYWDGDKCPPHCRKHLNAFYSLKIMIFSFKFYFSIFLKRSPINNLPALVQMIAWRRTGDKPLSEPMAA